jgi:hypothetical protein
MEKTDGSKYEVPYLPIDPADVGRAYEPIIRINSQSGKSGVAHVLERDHGYRVPRELAVELSQAVQAVTDARGQELSPTEIRDLFERDYFDAAGPFVLESAGVERRSTGKDCAVVAQISVSGVRQELRGIGHGPVEAFVAALTSLGGVARSRPSSRRWRRSAARLPSWSTTPSTPPPPAPTRAPSPTSPSGPKAPRATARAVTQTSCSPPSAPS